MSHRPFPAICILLVLKLILSSLVHAQPSLAKVFLTLQWYPTSLKLPLPPHLPSPGFLLLPSPHVLLLPYPLLYFIDLIL